MRYRLWLALASLAGHLVRILLPAAPALIGLAALCVGAYMAWPPAGFMTGGLVVLADVVWSRREPPDRGSR